MIIKGIVCLVLGTLLLVVPEITFSLFGVSISGAQTFPAREYGAAMIGTLFITWYARNAAESQSRRAIILGLTVYDAIGVVITVAALLLGWFNWLGFGILAIYLFFTLGFGYYWFVKPVPAIQTGAV
jgi:hypothetical protein